MGQVILSTETTLNTPAAGQVTWGVETAVKRPMAITEDGVRHILSQQARANYLRNGGFWFAQRQAPATLTTYSSTTGRAFCADGWAITNENASTQYRRVDTISAPESGLQSQFFGEFTKITTTGKILVSQCIEAKDLASLRGSTVRFQCWLKAIIGTPVTLKLSVIQNNSAATADTIAATFVSAFGANGVDPTLGTNLAYLPPKSGVTPDNCTAQTNNVTASVTTTWQRFGFVVDVPANCKNLIVMVHTDNQAIATNGFAIGQASVTEGYATQDFVPRDLNTELLRVQRFYQKSFPIDTLPAASTTVATNGTGATSLIGKAAATALAVHIPIYFIPRMFKAPTVTLFTPVSAGAVPMRIDGTTPAVQTAAAQLGLTEMGVTITATGDAAGVVGDLVGVHFTADAEI